MAYAEICFAQAKTGAILELDMQKRFLDHSENAKGIPCNTYIPDSDIKKLVKVYEAIIVQNSLAEGASTNTSNIRHPDLHYRAVKEFFKYLRGEPRVLLNFKPQNLIMTAYNLAPMCRSKNKYVSQLANEFIHFNTKYVDQSASAALTVAPDD